MKSDFHYPPQLPENSRKITYETNPPSFVDDLALILEKGPVENSFAKSNSWDEKRTFLCGECLTVVAKDGQLLLTNLEEAPQRGRYA